ncbi:MAG: hypothetical protein IT209_00810 [Armatimonadetes bacterium]|nr:hypothetical protein [Armatimonadota bacterium]
MAKAVSERHIYRTVAKVRTSLNDALVMGRLDYKELERQLDRLLELLLRAEDVFSGED